MSESQDDKEEDKPFEGVPAEEDTQIIGTRTEKHEGYDVRFEGWRAQGFFGKSLVFKAEEVAELDDAALLDLCRRHSSCPDDEKDDDFTISRDDDGYTFVNFGMEKDGMSLF